MGNEFWDKNKGACIGLTSGLVLGIVYLIFGFWSMLIFAFIVFIGYYLGRRSDRKEPISLSTNVIYEWLMERWRMFK